MVQRPPRWMSTSPYRSVSSTNSRKNGKSGPLLSSRFLQLRCRNNAEGRPLGVVLFWALTPVARKGQKREPSESNLADKMGRESIDCQFHMCVVFFAVRSRLKKSGSVNVRRTELRHLLRV